MLVPIIFVPFLLIYKKKKETKERKYKPSLIAQRFSVIRKLLDRQGFGYSFLLFYMIVIILMISIINHNGFPEGRKIVVCLLAAASILMGMMFDKVAEHSKALSYCLVLLLISSNALFIAPLYPLKYFQLEKTVNTNELPMIQQNEFIIKTIDLRSYQLDLLKEMTIGYRNAGVIVRETIGDGKYVNISGNVMITPDIFMHMGMDYTNNMERPLLGYDFYLFEDMASAKEYKCAEVEEIRYDYFLWEASPDPYHRHFYNKYENVMYLASRCDELQ